MSVPHVLSFVQIQRVANGVSRVAFRVAYDEKGSHVREKPTTLRKARDRVSEILAKNKHARHAENITVTD